MEQPPNVRDATLSLAIRSLGLEPGPQLGMALPQPVQVGTGVGVAVRICGNVDDAEIYAEPIVGASRRRFGHVHHHGEVERPVPVDEFSLSTNALQVGSLIPATGISCRPRSVRMDTRSLPFQESTRWS